MKQAELSSSPTRPIEQPRTWRPWLAAAALLTLVTVVYLPTLDNGFVNDDDFYVKHNLTLRSLDGLATIWFQVDSFEQYYPLVLSTFWVEHHLWGVDPRGYHAVNFVLHGVAAVLVWRLLVRLAVPGAWLAAAIWAVHPIHVESVDWVHELKNVLSLVLGLGTLLAYFRFSPPEAPVAAKAIETPVPRDWRYYALAFGLFVAALLAKTVMVSLPAVLIVIYWWKRGRVTGRDVAPLVPFLAIGLALSRMTVWLEQTIVGASGQDWDLSWVVRVLIAGRALCFYVGKLLWPHPLIHVYPRWVIDARVWWQYLFPAMVVAVIVGLWLARKRVGRGPLAAVLIFAGVMVPALGFFDLRMFRYTFVMNYYPYHASIALFAPAVAVVMYTARKLPWPAQWTAGVVLAGLLVPLSLVAQERMRVFRNDVTALEDLVAQDPQSWAGHQTLALFRYQAGRYEEALAHFRTTVEIRERLAKDNPNRSDYQNELAECWLHVGFAEHLLGQAGEEEIAIRKAIDIREKLVHDHRTIDEYRHGLASCYVRLAVTQQNAGRPDEAVASHRKAIDIREQLASENPASSNYANDLAGSYVEIGILLRDLGRPAQPESALHRAIEIRERLVLDHPTIAEYQASLATDYEELAISQLRGGQAGEALTSRRKAIAIREQLVKNNGTLTVARRLGNSDVRQKLAQDNLAVGKYQDDVAASYIDLGSAQLDLGRPLEAEEAFRRAIEIREKLTSENSGTVDYQVHLAASFERLAGLQRSTNQPTDALASFRKAFAIRRLLANDNPTMAALDNDVAASYMDLGSLERELGQGCEAARSFQNAIEIRERLVRDHPTSREFKDGLAWGYVDLTVTQFETAQLAEAEVSCRKAIELRRRLVQENPTSGDYKNQLALSYRDLANLQRAGRQLAHAVASYQLAIEIREQLVQDYPGNRECQSNLAADLAQGANALALLGRWSESADMYARSVAANGNSWQTRAQWALVQLAAGDKAAYQSTCADLVRRYVDNATPEALVGIAWTLVAGEPGPGDVDRTLALAKRSADANPSSLLAPILVGAAEHRAGRDTEAIATLTGALSQLDRAESTANNQPDEVLISRIMGQTFLALAYQKQSDRALIERQLETLRTLINKSEEPWPPTTSSLPDWSTRFAVEIAKRALAKLSVPIDAAPTGS